MKRAKLARAIAQVEGFSAQLVIISLQLEKKLARKSKNCVFFPYFPVFSVFFVVNNTFLP
jgi:hypothetical protein